MLKFLVPSFIKNLDKPLLLNYPFWYIVKLHYLAYFTVVMWLISYLVGWLLPIDITSYNPMNVTNTWIFGFAVLAVILFCAWVYYLTIYNNEDHFGRYSIWDDTKLLGVFIIGINLLMSFSYPMQLCLKSRIGNTYDDATLANQYNILNLSHKYMTSRTDNFQYCGHEVHDTVSFEDAKKDTTIFWNERFHYDLSKYRDFINFYPRTDLDFRRYSFLSFFIDPQNTSETDAFKARMLTARQVENEYRSHTTDAAKLKTIEDYYSVAKLYRDNFYPPGTIFNYTPQDYLDEYNHYEKTCTSHFPYAYNLKPQDSTMRYLPFANPLSYMSNIYEAKFALPTILCDEYLLFSFYFSFFISLFIILFRNNKWQHFLVSGVTVIVLGIIIGIISLAGSEKLFGGLCIFTWLVAGAISLNYYFKKDRYRVTGAVATNLFYIALPLMPFFLCLYAHTAFGWLRCSYDMEYIENRWKECEIIREQFDTICLYAQISGILFFVCVAMPFYKSFFATQKALPRER